MFFVILQLVAILHVQPALAGGVPCQTNGTCQCQVQGTCDKFGHGVGARDPSAGLHPEIAECLSEGSSMDQCLERVFPGRTGILPEAGPAIECGEGTEAFRVKLAQPFSQMPREGEVAAEFENLPLVISSAVRTRILPIFHMREISFQTAYCGFAIQVDSAGEGKDYVFGSSSECEGERRDLSCRVL